MRWPEIKKGEGRPLSRSTLRLFAFLIFSRSKNSKRKLKGKTARIRRVNFQMDKSSSETFKRIPARFLFEIRQD